VVVLDEDLEEPVDGEKEMGWALVDTGESVVHLGTVQARLVEVGEPVVLTCVAFLNVGDLGIVKHSVELFA
jgi:hypothetical protein